MSTEGGGAEHRASGHVAGSPAAQETGAAGELTVELRGLTKRFGPVVACRDVSLAVRRGEIHGLLGENGAGKSTLMKLLVGLLPSDAGEIRLMGRPVAVRDPFHAASLGLAMAQQHFSLVERLRVWENVALAHRGRMTRREAARVIAEIGERYGLATEPNRRVEDLTVGQRQRVELVKCLSLKPEVLILDEPTSVLTRAESGDLFSVLRTVVRRDGLSVILISHKLDEILQATDLVTIMRDGSVVASLRTVDADAPQLAKAMVGREVLLRAEMAAVGLPGDEAGAAAAGGGRGVQPVGVLPGGGGAAGPALGAPASGHARGAAAPAIALTDLSARGPDGRRLLDGLSLAVGVGEIVGVAGVDGNGQASIGDVMSGILPIERGRIEVGGREIPARAADLLRAGVGVIPEDRHASGCILSMSIEDNLAATDLGDFRGAAGLLDRRAIRSQALDLMAAYGITAPSPATPMSALSGGNQQRVVVARELSRDPAVLIAVQPSRGLDVGAIEFISEQLREAARRGVGILLISSELDELLALAERIVVVHAGRVVGGMPRGNIDVERLSLLMGGRVA